MSNIALIPVRGGSKSIPLKNIKIICGKPLVYWATKAASNSKVIDKVIVATDHIDIRNTVINFNLDKVEIYDRREENAQDTSSTKSLVLEYIENSNVEEDDNIFLIQATSPMITSKDIEGIYNKMLNEKADSALTCVSNKRFYWTKDGKPINHDINFRPRRQDFEGYMLENGACYINSVKNLKRIENVLNGKVCVYEMPEYTGIEIDEEFDFLIVEKLMQKYDRINNEKY